jgi:hypothetical protein
MSARSSIVNALVDKLKLIDGTGTYNSNIFNNAYAKLKFWDEIQDFPSIYVVPGSESREYLPGDFTWGYLNVSLKVYIKDEDPQQQLEYLLEDIENTVDANRVLVYNSTTNTRTTEILISSIVTDEGLLVPYGVGEINLQIRYQVL